MFNILFVVLCVAYLLAMPWASPLLAVLLKTLPILMLVVRAAFRAPAGERTFLALGLICSLLGDALLAWSPDALFVQGLAAFLVAHVLYIVTFRRRVRYSNRSVLLAAMVLAWCGGVGAVVFPHLGSLRLPVAIYMAAILTMGVAAAFATGASATLFIGAFAFIVSDSIIAVDRFVVHFVRAPYLVMATYYFGQFCIVRGVVTRHRRDGERHVQEWSA